MKKITVIAAIFSALFAGYNFAQDASKYYGRGSDTSVESGEDSRVKLERREPQNSIWRKTLRKKSSFGAWIIKL